MGYPTSAALCPDDKTVPSFSKNKKSMDYVSKGKKVDLPKSDFENFKIGNGKGYEGND